MRHLVVSCVLGCAIVLGARAAAASCGVADAYAGTPTVPLGCPLVVYLADATLTPTVLARRDGAPVDVTGASTHARAEVDVWFEDDACTGEGHGGATFLERHTIELVGVKADDVLELEGLAMADGPVTVGASGPCPDPIAPSLHCPDETYEPCPVDRDDAGCSAGGAASGWAALALLALVRRRRDIGVRTT